MKHLQKWAISILFVLPLFAIPRTLKAQAPTSGSSCDGTFSGTFKGNLTVSANQNCIFNGGGVTGHIQQDGGTLTLTNAAVTGNVQITGASTFSIGPGSTIGGNLQIKNVTAPTGDGAAPAGAGAAPAGGDSPAPPAGGGCGAAHYQICRTTVDGNLQFQNNGITVMIGGACGNAAPCASGATCPGAQNTINGNLQVQNNSAAITMQNNTVTGNLEVSNNAADTTVSGNTVNGNLQDQNNTSPDQTPADVDTNTVGKNLQCQNNTPGTYSSNNTVTGNNQCYQ
jgi:hypothetical protein